MFHRPFSFGFRARLACLLAAMALLIAGCKEVIELETFAPLDGRAECVGRHQLVIPKGAQIAWVSTNIDHNEIFVMPSDGRSAVAQMDRHRAGHSMTKAYFREKLGEWNFGVFEPTNIESPQRFEIATQIFEKRLVLTQAVHSKSRVANPRSILSDRLHNGLRVTHAPGTFCFSGLGFSNYAPQYMETISVGVNGQGWQASLDIKYLGPKSEPLPIPSQARGPMPPPYDSVKFHTIWLTRQGQQGMLEITYEEDDPRKLGGISVSGSPATPEKPNISMSFELERATLEEAEAFAMQFLAGFMER